MEVKIEKNNWNNKKKIEMGNEHTHALFSHENFTFALYLKFSTNALVSPNKVVSKDEKLLYTNEDVTGHIILWGAALIEICPDVLK